MKCHSNDGGFWSLDTICEEEKKYESNSNFTMVQDH